MSPSESPEVSKKISATGEVPVKAVLFGSESSAAALDWPNGVNTVVAWLKMPRPEMLTTGVAKGDGIDISKESTLGKLPVANNTMEEFGPIPIAVLLELKPLAVEREGPY